MWQVRVAPCGDFDNHPFQSDHFTVEPLAAAMGAEIIGVRLPELSDEGVASFKQALWQHKMVYLRDQHLTHAEHAAFSRRLGPFAIDAYTQGVPEERDVHPIIKEAHEVTPSLFGGGWHTDSPFLPEPPSITFLRQIEGPPYGGDTTWTNTALAFKHLSTTFQDMLRPLQVWMSAANNFATQTFLRGEPIGFGDKAKQDQGLKGSYHPFVRTHPVTGQPSLYICDTYAAGILGMTTHEAKPLIDFLVAHTIQHAFTCRLRWQPGMVCLWDNAATMHLGPNDYDGFRREMYRTTIAGGVPT
jgi:alpha-ketoglutarate-dependent taurine dioxygenase